MAVVDLRPDVAVDRQAWQKLVDDFPDNETINSRSAREIRSLPRCWSIILRDDLGMRPGHG